MEIRGPSDQPTRAGPAEYFTGTVWMDPINDAPAPARVRVLSVTFAPGSRTFWHTHPLGQTLHVVSGVGRAQAKGGRIRQIRAGDTVWIPPGERHWHGAAPDQAMVHLAVHETLDGSQVEWLEEVSEADYAASPA